MKYRPEIDGLRAIAILSVLLFHADFGIASGGFVGVDVFFVISGYLIARIVINEVEAGTFSFKSFFERRVRRLLPAQYLLLSICLPLAWLILPPSDLINFSKSMIYIQLFCSNFFFWKDVNYFETASELKPLLHTWSLSVEEQFYFFFPFLLVLLWKKSKQTAFVVLLITGIFSLFLANSWSITHPRANFFLLPTRFWELATGCLLSFISVSNKYLNSVTNSVIARNALSLVGLIAVFWSIFFFDNKTPFPSIYSLVPCLGTGLILLFGLPGTLVGTLLSFKFLVRIGLISYGLYLWHQPLFCFARFCLEDFSFYYKIAAIFASFLASYLSYKAVEFPFRQRGIVSVGKLCAICSFFWFFFFISGLVTPRVNFKQEFMMAKQLAGSSVIYGAPGMDERRFVVERLSCSRFNVDSVILGSSRMMQIGTTFEKGQLLNLSVSSAVLEDFVGICFVATKNVKANRIVLGIDPWLFNSKFINTGWHSISQEVSDGMMELNPNGEPLDISNSKIRPRLGFLYNRLGDFYRRFNFYDYRAIDDFPGIRGKIRFNGSYVYDLKYSNNSSLEIETNDFSRYQKIFNPYEFSFEKYTIFSRLVDYLGGYGEVVLFMSPIHPNLSKAFPGSSDFLKETEFKVIEIARLKGVKVFGSYDPYSCGCQYDDFYDLYHPKAACVERVFRSGCASRK